MRTHAVPRLNTSFRIVRHATRHCGSRSLRKPSEHLFSRLQHADFRDATRHVCSGHQENLHENIFGPSGDTLLGTQREQVAADRSENLRNMFFAPQADWFYIPNEKLWRPVGQKTFKLIIGVKHYEALRIGHLIFLLLNVFFARSC